MTTCRTPLLALAALIALPAATAAQSSDGPPPFRFAELSWDAGPPTVQATLSGMGFTYDEENSDPDDLVFLDGRLLGHDAMVIARMYRGTLTKVSIYLQVEPKAGIVREYEDIVEMLDGKYGRPTNALEVYQKPYEKGDGYEVIAIQAGKGHLLTYWERPTTVLGVQVTDTPAIRISYEGPDWSEAVAAREEAASEAF